MPDFTKFDPGRTRYFAPTLVRIITHHRLRIAVLSGHGQVQSEEIAVEHVHVAGLRSAQRINPPIERLISTYLDGDLGVFAVN